jgi:mono/diheme cytochrome c family protein
MRSPGTLVRAAVLGILTALFLGAGCQPAAPGGAPAAGVGGNGAAAVVPAAYTANCAKCHGTPGQPGGGSAPDLSREGAAHDATWITAHIKDPKTHNPGSSMPAFASLPESDIKAIADYLAGLK